MKLRVESVNTGKNGGHSGPYLHTFFPVHVEGVLVATSDVVMVMCNCN